MLINTKHIVMFDDAVHDFARITDMVDNDGAVLLIKDGRPAYAIVPFDEVQEAERPATGSTPKVEEPTCGCGKPQSQCNCGGHGPGGHGHHGHGHEHGGPGGHDHGGHRHGGPDEHECGGGHGHRGGRGRDFGHFGHGGDAGHIHPEGPGFSFPEDAYPEGEPFPGSQERGGEWDFSVHTGSGFDPLFRGGPEISIEEVISKVPPEVLDAGRRFVNQLSPLIGLFGGATPFGGNGPFGSGKTTAEPVDDPKDK